jgi:hypothetical protein
MGAETPVDTLLYADITVDPEEMLFGATEAG